MKTIIRLDASALKESSCLLRTYNTVVKGYRSDLNSIDIMYGLAFHAFIHEMKLCGGKDFSKATQVAVEIFRRPSYMKPKKQWMTEPHMLNTCFSYWNEVAANDEWRTVEHEGIQDYHGTPKLIKAPLVELKFAIPYYQDDFCEVILCGTIDDIARRGANGAYVIRDYKTTSVWGTQEYFNSYRLSPQLYFYVFIMHEYARLYPDSLIADIVKTGSLGAMIEGIFLKGEKPASFEKSEVFFFKPKQLADFKQILDKKIADIVAMIKSGKPPVKEGLLNGSCATLYGACKYANACAAPDEIAAGHVLNNNFITKTYDPLNFH